MKNLKALIAGTLTGVMMLSVVGCANLKLIDDEDVIFDALDEAVGIDEDDCSTYKDSSVDGSDTEYEIYAYDKDCTYIYIRFEDEEDAMDYFEDFYDDFQDAKEDKDLEGSYRTSLTGSSGYIVINGESKSDDLFDSEIYGGFYVKDNVFIAAYTLSDKDSKIDNIKSFLGAIGYPKP
ncbi:MAG: hypothetical protein K5745_01525 [Saccharofermentans sp.]|nr:hypothetical protein [Saccharofermentans sp.]